MRAVIEKVAAIGASIASVLFILAGAMLTYEVVARYFFTKPTRWAAELSQMCLIWGSLLAMAWLLKKRQHIQVDAVVRLLPGALARIIDRIVMLLVAIFSIVVCWYGFEIFYDSFSRGRTTGSLLNIPIWIVELAVPAGFALLALQALLETSRPSTEDSSVEHTP
jgi:TRAP-type C4-dicarboxylate transport system permease small subunit